MVLLMEEFGGMSLKRKGGDEPELFGVGGDDRSGFPLSCRATKMRRLACPDAGQQHCRHGADGQPVTGGAGATDDLPMGDAVLSPAAAEEDGKAIVPYGGGASDAGQSALPRLRPCGAHVRTGADWVVRAMFREADSRTVRELLAGAHEQGGDNLALAVVPWVPPPPAEEEAEPSATAGDAVDDDDGTTAMDVEEDEDQVNQWTRPTAFGGEGFVYRWPQHCMVPPQLPVVGQASPAMWSW